MTIETSWKYGPSVTEERQLALAQPGSFLEVVRLVVEDARNIRVSAKPGRDPGLTDCVQPIFFFELPNTHDIFFNGPWGYRAQYWLSPGHGLAANSYLLAALVPKLLASIGQTMDSNLEKIDVCASLSAASAKIWIEEDLNLLRNPTRDLYIERWLAEADKGVELARYGVYAPSNNRFEVKGALMDPFGNEVVPARKIHRHFDIHHYGFS